MKQAAAPIGNFDNIFDGLKENISSIEKANNLVFMLNECLELNSRYKGKFPFTYKKSKEYEWDIYINGDYFYTFSTPMFKILMIMIDMAERAHRNGYQSAILDILNSIKKKI